MKLRYYVLLFAWLLAACAPVQVGLETASPTVPAVTATVEASSSPEAEATASPTGTAPPTADVNTVTPSATVPSVTSSATASATIEPSATLRSTATRPRPSATLPAPTATEPVPTPPEPVELQLLSFTTDRTEADPGEGITLSWTTQNATGVRLVTGIPDANGSLTFSVVALNLPPQGSITVGIENIAPAQLFQAQAFNSQQQEGPTLSLSIARRSCPESYAFVFPPGRYNCAATASTLVPMMEQTFEHGRLLWMQSNNWINPRSQPIIFVLNEHGGWVSRSDTWLAGEPESDSSLVPPAGLYQPVRSFGKVWREEFRETLGWALAPEHAYNGFLQEGWARQPGFETGAPGWYARDLYVRLANNDVVRLVWNSRFTGQTWELLSQ